jgi:hypothetical protein
MEEIGLYSAVSFSDGESIKKYMRILTLILRDTLRLCMVAPNDFTNIFNRSMMSFVVADLMNQSSEEEYLIALRGCINSLNWNTLLFPPSIKLFNIYAMWDRSHTMEEKFGELRSFARGMTLADLTESVYENKKVKNNWNTELLIGVDLKKITADAAILEIRFCTGRFYLAW